jgi:adenylate kinase family enzyme
MTYSAELYQQKKEAFKAASKRYYDKNRETILQKQKLYDQQHREQIKKRHQEKKYYRTKIQVDSNTE